MRLIVRPCLASLAIALIPLALTSSPPVEIGVVGTAPEDYAVNIQWLQTTSYTDHVYLEHSPHDCSNIINCLIDYPITAHVNPEAIEPGESQSLPGGS